MDLYCYLTFQKQNWKLKNNRAFKILSDNYLKLIVLYPAKLSANACTELRYSETCKVSKIFPLGKLLKYVFHQNEVSQERWRDGIQETGVLTQEGEEGNSQGDTEGSSRQQL